MAVTIMKVILPMHCRPWFPHHFNHTDLTMLITGQFTGLAFQYRVFSIKDEFSWRSSAMSPRHVTIGTSCVLTLNIPNSRQTMIVSSR